MQFGTAGLYVNEEKTTSFLGLNVTKGNRQVVVCEGLCVCACVCVCVCVCAAQQEDPPTRGERVGSTADSDDTSRASTCFPVTIG